MTLRRESTAPCLFRVVRVQERPRKLAALEDPNSLGQDVLVRGLKRCVRVCFRNARARGMRHKI